MNGTDVCSAAELRRMLNDLRAREPFFAELTIDSGATLLLGIGDVACVQFSVDDDGPYLMAVGHDVPAMEREVEFLIGGIATEVPSRFSLPYGVMVEIAVHFVESGGRHASVAWEEL